MHKVPDAVPYRFKSGGNGMNIALASVFTVGLLWWYTSAVGLVHSATLPSPHTVWSTFKELVYPNPEHGFAYYAFRKGTNLFTHAENTALRLLLGILVGLSLGLLFGIILSVLINNIGSMGVCVCTAIVNAPSLKSINA